MADFNSEARISLEYQQYLRALDELIRANRELGKAVGLSGQQVAGFEKRLEGARAALSGKAAEQRRSNEQQREENRLQKIAEQQGRLYAKYLEDQARGLARKEAEQAKSNARAVAAEAAERKLSGALADQIERIRTLNQQTRALADSRKQLRSNLDTNLGFIPANGTSPRVGSSFGNIVDFGDKAAQQASRSYANLSTSIDGAIDSRRAESTAFASSLQARLQEEQATKRATEANKGMESQLIRARYALYDVATSYAAVAAATLGAVTATGVFATRYETAFTEIERTTLSLNGQVSANINQLRQDFLDLSETIPLTFQELTKIGALGAQLGIAEQDLVSFTETVAQFSRLSGVSPEESALAFGRIGELLNVSADQYVNLGSAISAVAISSAATDAQIISLTRELAAGASGAGFTADQVVGLSSALASLGVAPERARGALSTYFGTLNRAVAEGGQSLADFAAITGLTSEKLEELVRAGEGQEVLQAFIQGLNELDNVAKTQALDRLGLSQLRIEDTFRRLGQNVQFVNEQFQIAESAYADGAFLGDAYAVVLDDVASQFQLLLNSVGRFLATAGAPFLEFLRTALPIATGFFGVLSDIAESQFGEVLFRAVGAALALVGALAAVRSVAALTAASLFAIQTAASILGGTGVIATLRGVGTMFGFVSAGAATASGAVTGFGVSLGALAARLGVIGLVATAFTGLVDIVFNGGKGMSAALDENLGAFYRWAGGVVSSLGATEAQTAQVMADIRRNVELTAASIIAGPLGGFIQLLNTGGFGPAPTNTRPTGRRGGGGAFERNFSINNSTSAGMLSDADRQYYEQLAAGADVYAESLSDVGTSAGGAARQVRTLVDYANDLSSVFGRAFNIRFGAQSALDDLNDSWETLNKRVRDARIELQQLTADRNVKEYFLSVAEAYGDELRAGVLRGEIAEINEKMAETQADASTELEGNSKAARQNRSTITGLVKQYQDYIAALAESGADQATLNAAVARSQVEFIAQAQALGFSNQQLQPYIASFRDMTTIINNIPRNITVSVNADPALQALAEFEAAARRAGAAAGAISLPSTTDSKGVRQAALAARILAQTDWVNQLRRSGNISGAIKAADLLTSLQNDMRFGNYATGGYTGRGGKYEPAGIVHKGEYVIPKSQVNQSTGLPYANALGGQMPSSRGASYAGGGFVGGGGMGNTIMVELSAYDRKLLAQAGNVQLMLDGQTVARATNRANTLQAQRGTN